jgi:hypothetical protein
VKKRGGGKVGVYGKLASGLEPSRRCLAATMNVRGMSDAIKARPAQGRGESVWRLSYPLVRNQRHVVLVLAEAGKS